MGSKDHKPPTWEDDYNESKYGPERPDSRIVDVRAIFDRDEPHLVSFEIDERQAFKMMQTKLISKHTWLWRHFMSGLYKHPYDELLRFMMRERKTLEQCVEIDAHIWEDELTGKN